jgi:hypothetical protein
LRFLFFFFGSSELSLSSLSEEVLEEISPDSVEDKRFLLPDLDDFTVDSVDSSEPDSLTDSTSSVHVFCLSSFVSLSSC